MFDVQEDQMNVTQPTLPGVTEAEMVSWLRQQSWSDFARDLTKFYDDRGFLTAKQLASATGFRERQAARQAARAADRSTESVSDTTLATLPAVTPLPIGTFTVEYPDGHYRTFSTALQPADASFAPGEVILSFLSGQDNEADYTGFAFVKGTPGAARMIVWKRFRDSADLLADAEVLLADPEADNVLMARHCLACGRKLTRPSSVHANIGPECIKKFGGL